MPGSVTLLDVQAFVVHARLGVLRVASQGRVGDAYHDGLRTLRAQCVDGALIASVGGAVRSALRARTAGETRHADRRADIALAPHDSLLLRQHRGEVRDERRLP